MRFLFICFFSLYFFCASFANATLADETGASKARQSSDFFMGGVYKKNAQIVLIERNAANGNKINLNTSKIIQYKNLEISLVSCWQSSKNKRDNIALILVEEYADQNDLIGKIIEKNKNLSKKTGADLENPRKVIFYGWIFSKYKYINNIKHPIFDIWLDKCV